MNSVNLDLNHNLISSGKTKNVLQTCHLEIKVLHPNQRPAMKFIDIGNTNIMKTKSLEIF
jgi:hypothetical protein